MMRRRDFLLGAAFAPAAPPPLLLLSGSEAQRLSSAPAPLLDRLRRDAAAALKAGPFTITAGRPAGAPGGVHDYYSEGPYWWPDPKNPNGPYIRKDGERNPGRFLLHREALGALCEATLTLALAATALQDRAAAAHAARLLRVWFLDPATRMNPHLDYGQAVRGHRDQGRGAGIIDTRGFIYLVQGVVLLERAPAWPAEISRGLRDWFARYLDWLFTSANGREEAVSGNNHASWWTTQVLAFALFSGNAAAEQRAYGHYRTEVVAKQLRADGSAPREEARTRSLSYSAMNLDACAETCRMAQLRGEQLWAIVNREGGSLLKSIAYLEPFLREPARWKKPQIGSFNPAEYAFLGLAGMSTGRADWVAWQRACGPAAGARSLLHTMLCAIWRPAAGA